MATIIKARRNKKLGWQAIIRNNGHPSFKKTLVGVLETGNEKKSPINWTRNRWFILANRDSHAP